MLVVTCNFVASSKAAPRLIQPERRVARWLTRSSKAQSNFPRSGNRRSHVGLTRRL